MIAPLMVLGLLAANGYFYQAHAHNWNGWHWDKGGSQIVIYNYNYASSPYAAAAIQNGWNSIGILYDYSVNYHTDISVFDGNFGATGWSGLAEIWDSWDWGCWCWDHISHGHARTIPTITSTPADNRVFSARKSSTPTGSTTPMMAGAWV